MDYIEIDIAIPDDFPDGREIVVALLNEEGYDTFLESAGGIITYAGSDRFSREELERSILFAKNGRYRFRYSLRRVPDMNWNKIWEESFSPVTIGNSVAVRAPFHNLTEKFAHEIIIEPRMAFGTGHHETTELMMRLMVETEMKGMKVADLGCGTGILAILASMMGAVEVTAVDNDPVAVENCLYNAATNNIRNIRVLSGESAIISSESIPFNVILANITRNILTGTMDVMAGNLAQGGHLLLSGFYEHDSEAIVSSASANGLKSVKFIEKNNWTAGSFTKL